MRRLGPLPLECDVKVYGVDFSGARSDSSTWLAEASLDDGVLALDSCRPIRRAYLTELLNEAPAPCFAAMDFPFGLPLAFAAYWLGKATNLVDLWETAAVGGFERFLERRDAFVEQQGEPKRVCDTYYPESYSSLHRANPNMLPMTYRGIEMMAILHDGGWSLSPMGTGTSDSRTAIEVMPGATLRALDLPYKGYKKGRNRFEMRRRILDGLAKSPRVRVAGLAELSETCMTIDDALDAVVAALTGALWLAAPQAFRLPAHEERDQADIEGWMCVPAFLTPPA